MKQRCVIANLLAFALGPAIALAQSPPERDGPSALAELENALIDVIAQVEPSVVAIARATPPQAQARVDIPAPNDFDELRVTTGGAPAETVAAGVVIDPAGLVLTEFLAVREGDLHTVTLAGGESYPAQIKAADPRSGLAVLAIQPANAPASPLQRTAATPAESDTVPPATFPAIRFGNADNLRKGQFVIAVGNPYAIRSDGQPTASWGIVANLARKAPPGANLNNAPGPGQDYRTTLHHLGTLIQTDAALGWSAGGGALVNLRGELVGLTTTAAAIAGHEQPAGYAIPINTTFRRIIDALQEGREVEYGLLGVRFGSAIPIGTHVTDPQITVQYTYAGSPADRAGIKPNDVILGVDGKAIRNVDELQLSISRLPPTTSTTIDYVRGGYRGTAQVSLAKLGVPGNRIVTNRPPAWRGIRVDYATALDAMELGEAVQTGALDPQGCVLVAEVEPDSAAADAGIRAGMFISHVGTQRVTTPGEFYDAVKNVGDELDIRTTQPIQPAAGKDADRPIPDSQPPPP